ncbi:MAG: hypothetical protein ACLP7Q_09285 [Isosphaeraceae bacterium]
MSSTTGNPGQQELLLKMYDTLRKEVETGLRETRVLAVYALLATGAVWPWAVTNLDMIVPKRVVTSTQPVASQQPVTSPQRVTTPILLVLPAVLTALFWMRAVSILVMVGRAGDHLAKLEHHFEINAQLGWDSIWAEKHKRIKWCRAFRDPFLAWLNLFWFFIFAVNVWFGCACYFR